MIKNLNYNVKIDEVNAQIEVRMLEFNAIVKLLRTRKFKELCDSNHEGYSTRFRVYEERQFELHEEIDELTSSLGGTASIWPGVLKA